VKSFDEVRQEFLDGTTPSELSTLVAAFSEHHAGAVAGAVLADACEAMVATVGSHHEHIEAVAADQARLALQKLMEKAIAERT
jgi:hypothetical protein